MRDVTYALALATTIEVATRDGPVSQWVDRIGHLVAASGLLDTRHINWQGSPHLTAFRVAEELDKRCLLERFGAYLGTRPDVPAEPAERGIG